MYQFTSFPVYQFTSFPIYRSTEVRLRAAGHGLRPAKVRLAVAVPVPAGEELGHIAELIHGLGDCQVIPVLGLEIGLVLRVGEQVAAVEQGVSVAVQRQGVVLALPFGEDLSVGGQDAFPIWVRGRVGDVVIKWDEIGSEIWQPGGTYHDDVVGMDLSGERGHDLLVEILIGHLYHFHFSTAECSPRITVIEEGTSDVGAGLGDRN